MSGIKLAQASVVRLVCAILISIATLATPVMGGKAPAAEIPFKLRDGFIWIEVNVPRSPKPLNFLLDSGAQVSAINSRTAESLGMKGGRRVSVMGVGKVTTGLWPQTTEAHAAKIKLPRNYLVLDLSELGGACTNGPVDGLIGADFFRDRIVQLDYEHKVVRILSEVPAESGTQALSLKLRRCGMVVQVRINDSKPQWVRLDTGCASGLQWVTESIRSEQCTRRVAIALTKTSIPVTSTTVTLGSERFDGVPTDLYAKQIFPGEQGILGNGLLSRFRTVTVDAKGGRLCLR